MLELFIFFHLLRGVVFAIVVIPGIATPHFLQVNRLAPLIAYFGLRNTDYEYWSNGVLEYWVASYWMLDAK